MRIYSRRGDDGTTGLLYGGRVSKDSAVPAACGDVDEAQATLGLARAGTDRGSELDGLLVGLERDLWVLMAELAAAEEHRARLVPGRTLVTAGMVSALEPLIDDLTGRFDPPTEFVLPGQTPTAARLDLARTVVRRAERSVVGLAAPGSFTVAYLNRLSDLLWAMARWQEGQALPARPPTPPTSPEQPMPITFTLADEVPAAAVVGAPVFAGGRLPAGAGADLDLAFLAERGFEGRPGEALAVPSGRGTWIALGVGDPDKVTAEVLRRAAAAFVRTAWKDVSGATTLLAASPPGLDPARAAQAVAEGASLAAYTFSRYKAVASPCRLESVTVVGSGDAARHGLDRGSLVAAAVALARDLVNEPAGAMTPRRLAERAAEVAEAEGLTLTVLDESAIVAEGLGGLAGVALGSEEPPRLIELVYEPPGGADGTLAFVGKGITFDSGGLSIKTAEGMESMKTDKSGAAAVLAAMSVIAALAPPVKVVAIIPATENMPGGGAVKPGDVLRIRNGTTVEVLNTDAEGRLVLADGLSLAVEAGADAIVDVATLTGACVVALGRKVAGLMGNHEGWVAQVGQAAERAGEDVWPLPLPEDYRKLIDSDVADVKNISGGRYAGALTAGLFLREFVSGVPWAHLDIAGPARSEDDEGYQRKGGTGFGVRTLVEVAMSFRKP